jgi:hypothetical protein
MPCSIKKNANYLRFCRTLGCRMGLRIRQARSHPTRGTAEDKAQVRLEPFRVAHIAF